MDPQWIGAVYRKNARIEKKWRTDRWTDWSFNWLTDRHSNFYSRVARDPKTRLLYNTIRSIAKLPYRLSFAVNITFYVYQPFHRIQSIIKGKACSGCPAATCDNGLCACNNPFCGKNGKVNIKTCKCQCNNPFIGEACQQKSCKPDPGTCGPEQPYGFPKSFCEGKYAAFTKKTCPVMCGVCDASAVKPAEKKPCPKPDSADCGKKRPWGFPKRFCKGMYRQFMARTCPKLCGVCK